MTLSPSPASLTKFTFEKLLNKIFEWWWQPELFDWQISPHDSFEDRLELLIGGSIAEGIDRRVGIAQEVGKHKDVDIDTGRAKAGDNCKYVVGCPAGDKGS